MSGLKWGKAICPYKRRSVKQRDSIPKIDKDIGAKDDEIKWIEKRGNK